MNGRFLSIALVTILSSIVMLVAVAMLFSSMPDTELGLAITAGVWTMLAGLVLHVVARWASAGATPTRGSRRGFRATR